jgi:putative salt-induced outer membrane protein
MMFIGAAVYGWERRKKNAVPIFRCCKACSHVAGFAEPCPSSKPSQVNTSLRLKRMQTLANVSYLCLLDNTGGLRRVVLLVGGVAFDSATFFSTRQSTLMNPTPFKRAALAAACVLSANAMAQAKTDGLWRGQGGAALSATSGNTTTTSLLLNAEAARATTADKISLGGMVNYARSTVDGQRKTTSNKWGAFGQYDFNLTTNIFAFGKLGFEGDKLIDLSVRTSLAGGLGYKVINTAANSFTVFGGLGYVTDKYGADQTVGDKTGSSFSRVSLYAGEESSHQITPTVSAKQRLDLYPGLSGDKAFLAKFNASLNVAMSSTLNLSVGLTDSYNSKPPVGFKKNDLGLFTGVNVKFGAL